MKTTGALVVTAALIFGGACRDRSAAVSPASAHEPARYANPVPPISARVRVIVPELGPGWRVGQFNRTRQEPPCYLVMIYNPGHEMTIAATVYASAIARMQISTLYRGDTAVDRDPAAAAYEGEAWLDVSLDSAARSGHDCPKKIERAR